MGEVFPGEQEGHHPHEGGGQGVEAPEAVQFQGEAHAAQGGGGSFCLFQEDGCCKEQEEFGDADEGDKVISSFFGFSSHGVGEDGSCHGVEYGYE